MDMSEEEWQCTDAQIIVSINKKGLIFHIETLGGLCPMEQFATVCEETSRGAKTIFKQIFSKS